jgi:hypothetical protein
MNNVIYFYFNEFNKNIKGNHGSNYCNCKPKRWRGKTTTAVNLAASLAILKNVSCWLIWILKVMPLWGLAFKRMIFCIQLPMFYLGEVPIETAIQKAEVGYKVLGANRELAGVELAIAEQEGRVYSQKCVTRSRFSI